MGYEGRVQNTSVTFDPCLVDTHERRHALLEQAFVGGYALSGEAFYTRSRGLHALRDRPRKPDAVCARQPVPVAQDAQPVGRSGGRVQPLLAQPRSSERGTNCHAACARSHTGGAGAARSQSKNATGRPSRKTVFFGARSL